MQFPRLGLRQERPGDLLHWAGVSVRASGDDRGGAPCEVAGGQRRGRVWIKHRDSGEVHREKERKPKYCCKQKSNPKFKSGVEERFKVRDGRISGVNHGVSHGPGLLGIEAFVGLDVLLVLKSNR